MKKYKIKVSVRSGGSAPYKEDFFTTEVTAASEREAKDIAESKAIDDARKRGVAGGITAESVECVIV